MDTEQRTRDAIKITRVVLKGALTSPFTLALMTTMEIDPGHVEDKVYEVLCYLEKTKPEPKEEA